MNDATWKEVFNACCVHTPEEWGYVVLGICSVLFFLYFFLLGLDLLGAAAKVMGGCTAGSLFGDETNPVAALCIGILVTVLLQSSSTTTSIIVSLVGADSIGVKSGIYMIMGSNIGTSVTNTIVAMGQMGDGDQLERAFAGATVHDMFNFCSVIVLFPVELITNYLYHLSKAMLPDSMGEKQDQWDGPLKKIVGPLASKIIIANKDVSKAIAKGTKVCSDYYPVTCTGSASYENCKNPGLIKCDSKTNDCPVFFQKNATEHDDKVSGGVCFFLALLILCTCLVALVKILQKMLLGTSRRILYKATNINGYLAMVIGTGITLLVQSSSITTSALTPLVGMNVIQLEQMLPLTLGANIGTTFTGIMASLVSSRLEALQVALCHFWFNISGIIIWYPIPVMRNVPLNAARKLGKVTRVWKLFPIVYIFCVFFLAPLIILGISELFNRSSPGFTLMGIFILFFVILGMATFVFKWNYRGMRERTYESYEQKQKTKKAMKSLPNDMDMLKEEIIRLKEHIGLVDDDISISDDVEEKHIDLVDVDEEKALDDDVFISDNVGVKA